MRGAAEAEPPVLSVPRGAWDGDVWLIYTGDDNALLTALLEPLA